MANQTIFTKIVNGEIPSYKVAETEKSYAFLDINPLLAGHTLVIPKTQYETIHEIPEEDLKDLILLVKKVSTILREKLGCDGVNIQCSNGSEANQDIEHIHFHVIPRYEAESLDVWEGLKKAPNEVKEAIEKVHNKIIN
jgi:histidine triad (HIT) family protein